MDPIKPVPTQNCVESEHSVTETAGENDDMPSLDVLSFDQELCTSQNCHCHFDRNRRHSISNVAAHTPFGFRSGYHPPLKRPIAGSTGCKGAGSGMVNSRFARSTNPAVFGAPAYSSVTANCNSDARLFKQNGAVPDCVDSHLFGAKQCDRTEFHSFSQLSAQSSNADKSASLHNGEAYLAPQFQDFGRQPTTPIGNQKLDLSDLQSVLNDTVSASASEVTSCPNHLQPSSGLIHPCTCAQQAAKFDDWTVDELAGYFDDFCHIPKKMSAMAEMMYM